ncbi:hypothetical protein [Methylomonas sp. AM2-LC]|uniref:hypothetical protein n=1 Tax=Methylomonas sp. AM2-LC TaxID=3153301 RepID=UPI00326714B0
MQIIKILAFLSSLCASNMLWAQAAPSHGGHGGSSGGSDDVSCIKAKISHYKPEHLSSVSPGSEFSFTVSGSNGPNHIHVSIRQEPVAISFEDKESFFLVKGKLPANLKNETVRVSVRAKARISKCDADGGMLLKITE